MVTRINKFLSEVGYCSRRVADKLIEQGKVTINGEIPEIGTKIKEGDHVEVDGQRIERSTKQKNLNGVLQALFLGLGYNKEAEKLQLPEKHSNERFAWEQIKHSNDTDGKIEKYTNKFLKQITKNLEEFSYNKINVKNCRHMFTKIY